MAALPLHIAKKLQLLLLPEQTVPLSSMQHPTVSKMLEDGVLQKLQRGKTKSLLFIPDKEAVAGYVQNHFGIGNLANYIAAMEAESGSRAENIILSGNSKLRSVRTFKGFLVNCFEPVKAKLDNESIEIYPFPGASLFIHAFENFIPDPAVTIVGIENAENFVAIQKQRHLFQHIRPLFVSRYPQSKDVMSWLQQITNPYLHFGDFDFYGISIYQTEYKKHLGERAQFFIPGNTQELLQQYGNRELFNRQYNPATVYSGREESNLQQLIEWILLHKKVLEQEVFINDI